MGHEGGKIKVDFDEVEQQDLHGVSKLFFGEEVMHSRDVEELRKSPYIVGETGVVDDTFRSPYITPTQTMILKAATISKAPIRHPKHPIRKRALN